MERVKREKERRVGVKREEWRVGVKREKERRVGVEGESGGEGVEGRVC